MSLRSGPSESAICLTEPNAIESILRVHHGEQIADSLTGVTNNLERRVYEHKNKLVHGFTTRYNIKRLVFFEATDECSVGHRAGERDQGLDARQEGRFDRGLQSHVGGFERAMGRGVRPAEYCSSLRPVKVTRPTTTCHPERAQPATLAPALAAQLQVQVRICFCIRREQQTLRRPEPALSRTRSGPLRVTEGGEGAQGDKGGTASRGEKSLTSCSCQARVVVTRGSRGGSLPSRILPTGGGPCPHPFGCAEGRGALSPGDTRRGVEGEGAQTQSGEARSSRRCRWLLRRHPRRQRLEFCAHFAPLDLRQPQPLPDAVWFDAGPPFTQGEGPAAHVEG